jgi:hypothetical protein
MRLVSRQLDADARQAVPSGGPSGLDMASAAGHMRRVADAIHGHARELSPQVPGPSRDRRDGVSPERTRREETVLAGLLQQAPQRNTHILRVLPAEAIAGPHRSQIYQVLSAMHQAGKPVDEVTLDWELASRGVPLDGRQSRIPGRDDQTYAMRLARLHPGYEAPATAAAELAAEYGRSWAARPAGSAPRGSPDVRPEASAGRRAPAPRIPGRPVLRLIKPPPQAGPSERGPQQGR